jgi:hypothetical protein
LNPSALQFRLRLIISPFVTTDFKIVLSCSSINDAVGLRVPDYIEIEISAFAVHQPGKGGPSATCVTQQM